MRAFIYTERWPRTKDSDRPVTCYVISYYYSHKNPNHQERGCRKIVSTNKNHIRKEIIKIQKQGNTSLSGRLPPHMSHIEEMILEEHPEKPSVVVTRKGYDLSFLRTGNLPK